MTFPDSGQATSGTAAATESRHAEDQPHWLERLRCLNAVIAATGEPLEGNLFYEHEQLDFVDRPPHPILLGKRERSRLAVTNRRRLLEVGVNGGHFAYLALTHNPTLEYHGVDLCTHAYVRPAMEWLMGEFPRRVFLHEGDSAHVLAELRASRLSFDVFHVDAAKHTRTHEVLDCRHLSTVPRPIVIVDDTHREDVYAAWRWCVARHLVEPLAQFPSQPGSEPYRHEIGALVIPWQFRLRRAVLTRVGKRYAPNR